MRSVCNGIVGPRQTLLCSSPTHYYADPEDVFSISDALSLPPDKLFEAELSIDLSVAELFVFYYSRNSRFLLTPSIL